MSNNREKSKENRASEPKKSAGEIISKILTVICVISAAVLVCVVILAFINPGRSNGPDTGEIAPEIITTTEATTTRPTTTIPVDSVTVRGTVYATAKTHLRADTSKSAEIVATLQRGDGVGFVSVNKKGWCTVVYNERVCFVHKTNLSVTKPEVETTEAETTETTTKETTEVAQSAVSRKVVAPKNQKHWSVVVVDKNRQLPDDYTPELIYVAGSEHTLDARVAPYYDKMYNDAYAQGIVLTPFSGYRRRSTQESNFNALVDTYLSQGYTQVEAEELAATEILPPGCSEHNMGFAMDICSIEDNFKYTDEYEWLCENAYKYGFIERYPEGKQDITGVIPEPWHWRFIGSSYAKDMRDKGYTTLEEYLASYGVDY